MKIISSMIENIAIDSCLSVGCTPFIYSWGALKQGSFKYSLLCDVPWLKQGFLAH